MRGGGGEKERPGERKQGERVTERRLYKKSKDECKSRCDEERE